MLLQILTHTPIYVWAILALLVYRGIAASRDREMPVSKLFIIPAILLALSLQDLAARFGLGALTMAAWTVAALAGAALTWTLTSARTTRGATPGSVMVRGSWTPLASMMSVFLTKYTLAVLLAMNPQASQQTLVIVLVSGLFGILNGVFIGRLTRDAGSYFRPAAQEGVVA